MARARKKSQQGNAATAASPPNGNLAVDDGVIDLTNDDDDDGSTLEPGSTTAQSNNMILLPIAANPQICGPCLSRKWFDCDFAQRKLVVNGERNICNCCRFFGGDMKAHCKWPKRAMDDYLWDLAYHSRTPRAKRIKQPKAHKGEPVQDVPDWWTGEKPRNPPPRFPQEFIDNPQLYLNPSGKRRQELEARQHQGDPAESASHTVDGQSGQAASPLSPSQQDLSAASNLRSTSEIALSSPSTSSSAQTATMQPEPGYHSAQPIPLSPLLTERHNDYQAPQQCQPQTWQPQTWHLNSVQQLDYFLAQQQPQTTSAGPMQLNPLQYAPVGYELPTRGSIADENDVVSMSRSEYEGLREIQEQIQAGAVLVSKERYAWLIKDNEWLTRLDEPPRKRSRIEYESLGIDR